ncbi:MAG TPA: hypothetical protein VF406_21480 [Thermodesulfobacteriota bacterium]
MATYTKRKLSGSTDGKAITVAATGTPGTLIHTAVTGTTDLDEVYLYAVNTDTTARKLTLEFGGTTAPDNLIEQTIQPEDGLVLVVPGLLLQNAAEVRAFADAANVVGVYGFVNRIAA